MYTVGAQRTITRYSGNANTAVLAALGGAVAVIKPLATTRGGLDYGETN